jgi:hypothetical protein
MLAALACAATLAFYAGAYRTLVRRCGPLAEPLIALLRLAPRAPERDVRAVGKLLAAAVVQALFAAALLVAAGVSPPLIAPDAPAAVLMLGAMLGLGEIALAAMVCGAVVQLGSHAEPARAARWLSGGRGGWMALFAATMRTAPPWAAAAITVLYVGVEELVFRAILIDLLRPYGALVAIGIPLGLFCAAQTFHMPSLRAALFPVVGALVVGLTHGLLYWHVPALLPLIAAHLTFFLGAVWLLAAPRPLPT